MIATHYHRGGPATPDSTAFETFMIATSRAATALLVLLAAAACLGGCVYRPNIQQGNLLDRTDVDQVTIGMTRSQVRYLLGTPMLGNPFDPQRWDYIYTLRRGRDPDMDRAHFIVRFEGDKVSAVEMLNQVETRTAGDTQMTQKEKKKAAEELRESGTAAPLERGDQPATPAPAPPPPQ
jgi:outer membrane protein assembly factor BamE